jgi:hypothetical protein
MADDRGVTARDVARWMVEQISRHEVLDQAATAEQVARIFGHRFVHRNRNGTWAIARSVLESFRKQTTDAVVWEQSIQAWCVRTPEDTAVSPGIDRSAGTARS